MPYLEHTKVLLILGVTEPEEEAGETVDIEVGSIVAKAHYSIQLDDDAEKVIDRAFDALTIHIGREWCNETNGDEDINFRLLPSEVPVLRELLNQIEAVL